MKIYRLSIYRMMPNANGYEVFTQDFKTHASAHLSGVVFAKAVIRREVGLFHDNSRFVPVEPKSYDADEFTVEVKEEPRWPSLSSAVVMAYKIRIDAVDIATEALCTEDFKKLGVA